MKKITLTAAAIIIATNLAFSQGTAINNSGTPADSSAIFEVSSTTQGQLVPRMTTVQRNGITNPAQSLLIFNTTTTCFEYHYNGVWYSMSCTCIVPFGTTANAATNILPASFSANWNASSGATAYYLDVSTDAGFTNFVSGYNNFNAGGGTTYNVTGLTCNVTYYYRIRANNSCGTSANSNTISVAMPACFSCGGWVNFTYRGSDVSYGTVSGRNGTCWLDRNLGASQVATAYNDAAAYGDLFQWGRLDDNHQDRSSGTTSVKSTTDVPGHSNFITSGSYPYDWRNPKNDNLWQGVSGINNPCPSGWRLPSESELNNERAGWSQQNYNGAFASSLKLTAAGIRGSDGVVNSAGSYGYYWCYDISSTPGWGRDLFFYAAGAGMDDGARASGRSVRCIKN